MSFVEDILKLYVNGKLTKEATVKALAPFKGTQVKLAVGGNDLLTAILAQVGATKGLDLAERGLGRLWSHLTQGRRDALFQQMMKEHPSLYGKDPVRAKANFDYLAMQSPHLLDHPTLMGDQIANMTALGTTDIGTLKTIADTQKSIIQGKPQESQLARDVGSTVSKSMIDAAKIRDQRSYEAARDTDVLHQLAIEKARAGGKALALQDLAKVLTPEQMYDAGLTRVDPSAIDPDYQAKLETAKALGKAKGIDAAGAELSPEQLYDAGVTKRDPLLTDSNYQANIEEAKALGKGLGTDEAIDQLLNVHGFEPEQLIQLGIMKPKPE
jgi:hypothetical protein